MNHFVLTPFCIRNPEALRKVRGGGWLGREDPLAPDFLEARLRLMEMVSAPSLCSQTNQNFTWVLIVDPDLPAEARRRIERLSSPVNSRIHEYSDTDDWSSAAWLAPYMTNRSEFLLTTHMDDDDSISQAYLEILRGAAERFAASSSHGVARLFGAKKVWAWNRVQRRGSPWGTRSEWRGVTKVAACGFSLLCREEFLSRTVLGLRHKCADEYLDLDRSPSDEAVLAFRRELTSGLAAATGAAGSAPADLGFEDVSQTAGPVILTNHEFNVQKYRISRRWHDPIPVTGAETFPGHVLDWDAIRRYPPTVRESGWQWAGRWVGEMLMRIKALAKSGNERG